MSFQQFNKMKEIWFTGGHLAENDNENCFCRKQTDWIIKLLAFSSYRRHFQSKVWTSSLLEWQDDGEEHQTYCDIFGKKEVFCEVTTKGLKATSFIQQILSHESGHSFQIEQFKTINFWYQLNWFWTGFF